MAQAGALHQAVALAGSPLLAGAMRVQPLPPDVLWLIQIAAGDGAAIDRAAATAKLTPKEVREAAVLYLQHVVFAPGADFYRVLGAQSGATQGMLREHVAWLMRWLHPDHAENEWESVFVQRVSTAWNTLKTPDKRAAYDRTLVLPGGPWRIGSGNRNTIRRTPRGVPLIAREKTGPAKRTRRRVAAYLLAGAVGAFVILAAGPQTAPRALDEQPPPPAVADSVGF